MSARRLISIELTVPAYKSVPVEPPNRGTRRVADGSWIGKVELLVDVEALALDLGRNAIRSKGRRSSLASGLIVAKVIGPIRHEPESS